MNLVLQGGTKDVMMAMSQTGSWVLDGQGQHKFINANNEAELEIVDATLKAKSVWSIVPTDAAPIHIDGASLGLYKNVETDRSKPHGMLFLLDTSLLTTMALPASMFLKAKELIEHVLLNDHLEFIINLSHIGIRVPMATSESPTAAEFMSATPLFFNEINILVRKRNP